MTSDFRHQTSDIRLQTSYFRHLPTLTRPLLYPEIYRFSLFLDFPEGDSFFICELLHAPCGLEAAGHEVHGDKETNFEALDKLSASKGIAITNATVYGEHHHIEAIRYLADIFQLAQVLLFMGYWINLFVKLLTIDGLARHGFWQEPRIPVVQVAGMEDTLTLCLYYPRNTAVCAA